MLATDVAARGLDLPHIDVVIQFDPPSDPRTFSHRCGRTARAGRSGRAWALLVGREIEYVGQFNSSFFPDVSPERVSDFLSIRKIPMKEHPYLMGDSSKAGGQEHTEDPQVQVFLDSIRSVLITDRAIHDQESLLFEAVFS